MYMLLRYIRGNFVRDILYSVIEEMLVIMIPITILKQSSMLVYADNDLIDLLWPPNPSLQKDDL